MRLFLILKIIIIKILRLNLAFLKRQISGYPKFVKEFENNFAKYIGKKYAISFMMKFLYPRVPSMQV